MKLLSIISYTIVMIIACTPSNETSYESKGNSAYKAAQKSTGDSQRLLYKEAYIYYSKAIKEKPNGDISNKLRERYIEMTLARMNMVLKEEFPTTSVFDFYMEDVDDIFTPQVNEDIRQLYVDFLMLLADSSIAHHKTNEGMRLVDKALEVSDNSVAILEKKKMMMKEIADIEKAQQKEKSAALANLKKTHDDISGITWYKTAHLIHLNNTNSISLYMGQPTHGSPYLRLKMSYEGENWIFFTSAYLSYDSNTIELQFDQYKNKKSENGGSSVWEWIDIPLSETEEAFLWKFANSKNAKMRLSGKYTKTRNLSWKERQGIIDVLSAYNTMK